MRRLIRPVLFLLPVLAGCASEQDALAIRGQSELKGLSARELQSCAGQPSARHREGSDELWVYFREASRSAATEVERDTGPLARPAGDYEYFRYCEATFVFRLGRVSEVAMKGRTSLGRETLSACGPIVAPCLK